MHHFSCPPPIPHTVDQARKSFDIASNIFDIGFLFEADAVTIETEVPCGPEQASPAFDSRWHGMSIPKEHWHFHRALLARYRLVLGVGEFSRMMRSLRDGTALLIEKRDARGHIYSVRVQSADERIFILVKDGRPITAWPPSKRLNDLRRSMKHLDRNPRNMVTLPAVDSASASPESDWEGPWLHA